MDSCTIEIRVCIPNDDELKKSILKEAHNGSFAMHPGSTKMYKDLKTSYWWSGMNRMYQNL